MADVNPTTTTQAPAGSPGEQAKTAEPNPAEEIARLRTQIDDERTRRASAERAYEEAKGDRERLKDWRRTVGATLAEKTGVQFDPDHPDFEPLLAKIGVPLDGKRVIPTQEIESLKEQNARLRKEAESATKTLAERESAVRTFFLDGEIDRAIRTHAAKLADGAAEDLPILVRGLFEVAEQGGAFSVRPVTERLKARGMRAFDDNGEPRTVTDVIAEFLASKPHLLKAGPGGGGSQPGGGTNYGLTADKLKNMPPDKIHEAIAAMTPEQRNAVLKERGFDGSGGAGF
jgi:hypothetical protein